MTEQELSIALHDYLLDHETVELMQIVIDAIHEKNEREKADGNITGNLSDKNNR